MKTAKRKKKSIFLRVALLAFSVYVIVTLVQLQLEISERRNQIKEVQAEIAELERINENYENQVSNPDEYKDQQARKNGLARPGEQIYEEIPDN